jgi:hypothetical protein
LAGLADLDPQWEPQSFGEAQPQWRPQTQNNPDFYNYSGQFVAPPGYNMHPGLAYALGLVDPNWMMGRSLGVIPAAGQNI